MTTNGHFLVVNFQNCRVTGILTHNHVRPERLPVSDRMNSCTVFFITARTSVQQTNVFAVANMQNKVHFVINNFPKILLST